MGKSGQAMEVQVNLLSHDFLLVCHMVPQVTYASHEGIKSEVVLWGLEFPRKTSGATQFILSWPKSGLLVYTYEESEYSFSSLSPCYIISGSTMCGLYSCESRVWLLFLVLAHAGEDLACHWQI